VAGGESGRRRLGIFSIDSAKTLGRERHVRSAAVNTQPETHGMRDASVPGMMVPPSVLCPVDFSDASRGALRYAVALAEHFYAGVTVLTVDDPFLADAAAAALGPGWLNQQSQQALEKFVEDAFPTRKPRLRELRLVVETGPPATEILRVARETGADAIVMSTHGVKGVRKMMFGSVTERVLRDTGIPVIVTPAGDPGPDSLEQWRAGLRAVLVPVDLSPWTPRQVRIAQGLAEALDTRLVLTHVLEPLRAREGNEQIAVHADAVRRAHVHQTLSALVESLPPRLRPTMTIGVGEPATELTRIATEFSAGAIVMGLHSAPERGHRMGTVTYRLLCCQSPVLVVAWPPAAALRAEGDTLTLVKGHAVNDEKR
jgi:universal stress protein A